MRFNHILVRVVLVAASTLVTLLVCEGVVRVVAPQRITPPLADAVDGIITYRPNAQGRLAVPGTFDVMISITSQRFRGREELALFPGPGVVRIAALGDSFTFGDGAKDDETYPADLERILHESFGNPQVEVLNAGVGGTGTGEKALLYEVWVKQFHPRVVVLTVVGNDVDDDLERGLFFADKDGIVLPRSREEIRAAYRWLDWIHRVLRVLPGYFFLAQHSQLLSLLRAQVQKAIRLRVGTPFSNDAIFVGVKSSEELIWKKGLRVMAGEINWLKQRTQGSGARLVVVFFPEREVVYGSQAPCADEVRWKSAAISKTLAQVCSRESIPFLDATPLFHERAAQPADALYYNVREETHPTPAGYRLFAEAVSAFLLQQGILATTGSPSAAELGSAKKEKR